MTDAWHRPFHSVDKEFNETDADVAAILAELHADDIATLGEMSDTMNERGDRCAYGPSWTPRLRSIVERSRDRSRSRRLARRSAAA
jgi:hypothetical protein